MEKSDKNTISKKNDELCKIESSINLIKELSQKNDKQLEMYIKWNVDFDNQVRSNMQKELDAFRANEKGSYSLPIIKDILNVYYDYMDLMSSTSVAKLDKKVSAMFDSLFSDIEDILVRNGVEFIQSSVGSVRDSATSKVIETKKTDKKKLHNTIIASRRKGAVYGKLVLVREFVDVYVAD